jgi:hypothetical protein
VEYYSFVVVA